MSIYDNEKIFNSFLLERENENTPFNLQVKPIIIDFIGNVKGKSFLDLGCGLGHFAKELSKMGAKSIIGIDNSEKEILYANQNNKLENIEYKVLNAENIETLGLKFDIIVSNIVVDYIENLDFLLRSIHNCLNKGGLFVFSQVHPLSTAPKHKRPWCEDDFCKSIYQLSDYSFNGKREMNYFDGIVTMYHRTFSTILNLIIKNNFEILDVSEPVPSKDELSLYPERSKNLHKPSFLVFKLKKR